MQQNQSGVQGNGGGLELSEVRGLSFDSTQQRGVQLEVAIIKKYLGVRYRHKGRDLSGMDCYGLIILIYRDLGIDLFDLEDYPEGWGKAGKDLFLEHYEKDWTEVVMPHLFDVVAFKNYLGVVDHAGVMLSNNRVIQCTRVDVIITRLSNPKARVLIAGFYRHKAND